MKIAVIGTGYVGLVTGTCFAEIGHEVICVDNQVEKIDMLLRGEIPIYEPGLKELVDRNREQERIQFTTDLKKAVTESLFIFIAVGTPSDVDGRADLKYVLQVAKDVAKEMNDYKVIVNKSTVPVGTAEKVRVAIQEVLNERHSSLEFDLVSNPEFLKEGDAIRDFLKPDRVVVGTDNVRTAMLMRELYAQFLRTGHPVLVMDIKSAEMTKYASNAMLATRISFMNELAKLCDKLGADVESVRKGAGSDSRIGNKFLFSGIGFGGSCFPKDVRALIQTGFEADMPMTVLQSVLQANELQKHYLVEKMKRHFKADLSGKTIALWGLSFKPNTDDMREAPSLTIIEELLKDNVNIRVYDPVAMKEAKHILPDSPLITYCKSEYEACKGADALALLTEWGVFRSPNFDKIKQQLKQPVIFDGRNQYDLVQLRTKGFTVYSIGRDQATINDTF